MVPYTYLIGWTKQNKYYYGVQFGKECHPDNLWIRYFTSSKLVADTRIKFGEPDIIQVRKTFNSASDAIEWETKVLRRLNVIKQQRWLNQSNNKAIDITDNLEAQARRKATHSKTWKDKMSDNTYIHPHVGRKYNSKLRGVARGKRSAEWSTNLATSIKGFKWYHNPETLVEAKVNFNKGHIIPEGFILGRIPGKHGGSKGVYSKERVEKGQTTRILNNKPSPLIGKKRSEEDKAAMRRGKAEAKLRRIAINT